MKQIQQIVCIAALAMVTAGTAQADTLASLERERSLLIAKQLDPNSSQGSGQSTTHHEGRLLDLERAVANDRSLEKRFSAHARRALADYDLTFLIHASVERNKPAFAHWLDTVGLDATSLRGARMGRY